MNLDLLSVIHANKNMKHTKASQKHQWLAQYIQNNKQMERENTETLNIQHNRDRDCRCGCIPPNMFSLFEMAELRRKRREQQQLQQNAKSQNQEKIAPTE